MGLVGDTEIVPFKPARATSSLQGREPSAVFAYLSNTASPFGEHLRTEADILGKADWKSGAQIPEPALPIIIQGVASLSQSASVHSSQFSKHLSTMHTGPGVILVLRFKELGRAWEQYLSSFSVTSPTDVVKVGMQMPELGQEGT